MGAGWILESQGSEGSNGSIDRKNRKPIPFVRNVRREDRGGRSRKREEGRRVDRGRSNPRGGEHESM